MKSRRPRPLRKQLKVESMSARQPHDVAKIWIIVSVCAILTGSLLIFNPFKFRSFGSGGSSHTSVPQTEKQAAVPESSVKPPAPIETKLSDQPGTLAPSTTQIKPVPAPTTVPVTPSQPDAKTAVSDKEFLDGKPATAPMRKNVEKQRRQAERKRARLEEMYQKREISSDEYKKGQEEYRAEIGKYRSEAAGKDPTSG